MNDFFSKEELEEMMKPIHDRFEEIKDCEFVYFFDQKFILENIIIRNDTYIAKLFDLKKENKITIYNIIFLTKEPRLYGGKHSGPISLDYKTYMKVESLILPKEEKNYNSYPYERNQFDDYFEEMREREFARWY